MFLRYTTRKKNGKEHRYWSIVENRRLADGRVVQRHALYRGEINDGQERTWTKSIEAFFDDDPRPQTVALFPADRVAVVRLRLAELSLHRPRQWGACWLALHWWRQLELDRFWAERLPPNGSHGDERRPGLREAEPIPGAATWTAQE